MARDSQTSRSRSFRFRTSYVVVVVVVFSENPLILSFTRAYTADNISFFFFFFSLLAMDIQGRYCDDDDINNCKNYFNIK